MYHHQFFSESYMSGPESPRTSQQEAKTGRNEAANATTKPNAENEASDGDIYRNVRGIHKKSTQS